MSQAPELEANPQVNPAGIPNKSAKPNEMNLIWVDLEMTGLEPDTDRIIEIAVVVTDMQLNVLAEGPVCSVR